MTRTRRPRSIGFAGAQRVEELERVEDAGRVLAGDPEPLPLLGADAEEDVVEVARGARRA